MCTSETVELPKYKMTFTLEMKPSFNHCRIKSGTSMLWPLLIIFFHRCNFFNFCKKIQKNAMRKFWRTLSSPIGQNNTVNQGYFATLFKDFLSHHNSRKREVRWVKYSAPHVVRTKKNVVCFRFLTDPIKTYGWYVIQTYFIDFLM